MGGGDTAAAVALDIAEAKRLLGAATRPALQAVLGQFISEATARELALLTPTTAEADDEDDVVMVDESEPTDLDAVPNSARAAAEPSIEANVAAEPKERARGTTTTTPAADLLEPAPLKKPVDANVRETMVVDAAIASPAPTKLAHSAPASSLAAAGWIVPTYGWEQGEYNTPWVNVFVSLDGVGAAKDRVACDFTTDSFDLKVVDVAGKNYRLVVEALDKDIVPDESKVVVKKNRLVVKLKKVKGEYSFDHWTDLKKKGGKAAKAKEKSRDPTAGIMDMMKDLYDNGDDNMRKIIGESMLKSRSGEKPDAFDKVGAPTDEDDIKLPKFGDFDD